ncbi:hypothetical protein AVEN_205085-1 [Araneus ventricosus]|uniref:Uncharacterized protein n=1 Tax=Araneus ventricosus TaxID=182803 RepID=A0A4Y2H2C5_ARAVE|nr:hypothetical protein AVEN_205085-1 [Araneus ventricosus]
MASGTGAWGGVLSVYELVMASGTEAWGSVLSVYEPVMASGTGALGSVLSVYERDKSNSQRGRGMREISRKAHTLFRQDGYHHLLYYHGGSYFTKVGWLMLFAFSLSLSDGNGKGTPI